jgi:hypothetical protein
MRDRDMGDFGRSMVPDCDATASARARRCCCAIAVSILSGILFQNRRGLGLPSIRLHFVSDLRDDVDACGFSESLSGNISEDYKVFGA